MTNSSIRKNNREQYSLRCDLKYKLDVSASSFRVGNFAFGP